MGIKTPLYEQHVQLNARIVEFAGFDMPLSYSGIIPEHLAVRNKAGLFDVSHMGELVFQGPKAFEQVQYVTTNDVSRIELFQAQYSTMCKEDGGIVDDVLVYRLPDRYLMVVNAANRQKDYTWVTNNLIAEAEVLDFSNEYALLAIQGPESMKILQNITTSDLSALSFYRALETEVAGVAVLCSRTGYTGELGYELYVKPDQASHVWNSILDAGKPYGLLPVGLGARDSLRLEKCLRLYGNDMDESTNPYEAGLGKWVKTGKDNFVGKEILVKIKEEGVKRRLVGFIAEERIIPRHGYTIRKNGTQIGSVTSGMFSPVLKSGVGMGYVETGYDEKGTQIEIELRGKTGQATIVKMPFV